jgi:hypothetical protein
MTLNGFGFINGAMVNVGPVAVPATFVSSTQLTVNIPSTAIQVGGIIPISVKNPNPTLASSETLPLLLSNLPPVLNGLDTVNLTWDPSRPNDPPYTAQIVLHGSNFSTASIIEVGLPCPGASGFGPIGASLISTQEMVATVSIDCTGTYLIRVRTIQPAGGVSQVLSFQVTPYVQPTVPTITSLSPNALPAGSAGFTMTITGTNFVAGAFVNFGTSILVPSSLTSNSIVVFVPSFLIQGSGIVPVSVTNPNPTGTSNRLLFLLN